jgi:hypothetical protein
VMHYSHALEVRFTLARATAPATTILRNGEAFQVLQGPHQIPGLRVTRAFGADDACAPAPFIAQDFALELAQDPGNGLYTHPVAYLERGSHEPWPTSGWDYIGAASHDGAGPHHFLVSAPPNLGEVGFPNPDFPAARLVLEYNGRWGAFGAQSGDPAQGPPLHDNWIYPPCPAGNDSTVSCSTARAVRGQSFGY